MAFLEAFLVLNFVKQTRNIPAAKSKNGSFDAAPGRDGNTTRGVMQVWSGRPGSNRRHSAWEADVLPLNYSRFVRNYTPGDQDESSCAFSSNSMKARNLAPSPWLKPSRPGAAV